MEQVASWTKTGSMVAVKEETVEVVAKEESVEMGVKEETVETGEVETKLEVDSDTSSTPICVEWVEVGSDTSSSAIVISFSEGSEGDPIIKEELGVTLETPP